jgi:Rv2525c-like, glycoside hydrolase-like domain
MRSMRISLGGFLIGDARRPARKNRATFGWHEGRSAHAQPSIARAGRVVVVAVIAGLLTPCISSVAAAGTMAQSGFRRVTYLQYSFEIPSTWQVVNLTRHRHACVRFDRHVLYVGSPPREQTCPSSVIGTTEAMLIEPGSPQFGNKLISSVEDPVTRRITVTTRPIRVIATFGTDPAVIDRILASADLPQPVVVTPAPTASEGAPAKSGQPAEENAAKALQDTTVPPLPFSVTNYEGKGFDTCTAPSEGAMSAWRRSSPYRAIGIYIGGSDAACAQPNLTAAWLRQEAAAGWHFIPIYVGPQAAFGELHKSPASQAVAAATDAAQQAKDLGFGAMSPIYYDMEAYPPAQSGRALQFESAWTTSLHELGYSAGVYSSSASGIADLVHQYGRGTYAMPDVIYDALWNGQANTSDPVFRPGQWAHHHRLHQYSGNVTQSYGGVTMQIDQDYLNVQMPVPTATSTASQTVREANGTIDVFFRGSDDGLWYLREVPGKDWTTPAKLAVSVESRPSAVILPTGRISVYYRGAGGLLWQVSSNSAGWSKPAVLRSMGVLGSRPWALSELTGVTDVFWLDRTGSTLWYAKHTPGLGWSGPHRLGSALASYPSPAVSRPGFLTVLWEGKDRNLWRVTRTSGGQWSSPASLGMGPLGGWPHAAAQPDGEVQVFWRHHNRMLAAFFTGSRWTGPQQLTRGFLSSPAVPVSASDAVHVLFTGIDGGLWQVVRDMAGQWAVPARLLPGPFNSTPFAGNAPDMTRVNVFWKGLNGHLWWATITSDGKASAPFDLGGQMR